MKRFSLLLLLALPVLFVRCEKDDDDQPLPETPAANYADSIKQGLWAYFPLNGNFGDSSGHNRNLRGVNGIQFGADKKGTANNALLFDGVNDFAVIDSGTLFPSGNFTFSFQMYPQRTLVGRIFNKANYNDATGASINFGFDDDNRTNKLNFSLSNNPNICGSLWSAGTATTLYTNTVLSANSWYSVVAENYNGIMRVYINGQLIEATAANSSNFSPCSNAPIYFGIWWLNDLKPFQGLMDNIRIYNRTLSYKEIKYISDNSK